MKQFQRASKRGLSRMALAGYGIALSMLGLVALLAGDAGKGDSGTGADSGTDANRFKRVSMSARGAIQDKGGVMGSEAVREPPTSFAGFVTNLKAEAMAKGVQGKAFDAALAGVARDKEIFGFTTRQPEHDRTPWDYVGALVSPKRVEDGLNMLTEHAAILQRIEAAYGVDKHILVAIWGIETSYGSGQGERNVLRSLISLAYEDKRRAAFWKKQLLAALRIVSSGDIAASDMGGSWAGAMGHTQFMPTTYLSHAVDFDGDGRRDIWNSVADALASAANYLKASKWAPGRPWGFEVVLPEGFDFALSAPGNGKAVIDWLALGVAVPEGRELLQTSGPLELLLPAGARGPAFLVSPNFKAILKYNNSTLYALSAGLLAARLGGGPHIKGAWPTDMEPLGALQRRELQQLLVDRGLDTGGVDGILGGMSRRAIRAYQVSEELPADGFPSTEILKRLRGAPAVPSGTGLAAAAKVVAEGVATGRVAADPTAAMPVAETSSPATALSEVTAAPRISTKATTATSISLRDATAPKTEK